MWLDDQRHRAPLGDFPPIWASAWGDDHFGLWADLTITNKRLTATQRMRWIEPSIGEGFLMGSFQKERDSIEDQDVRAWANNRESTPHREKIAVGFWLADTPCTQAFWVAVAGTKNPSFFKEGIDAPSHPVERVPIRDDIKGLGVSGFLKTLNRQMPEPRATLPSEAEWEYACRADTDEAYWWGNNFDPTLANADHTGQKAWSIKTGTTSVHRYLPNPWGLHDMHGNVWEWCRDPWRRRWGDGDPEADNFVVRGGSWFDHPSGARAACRLSRHSADRIRSQGFRFALTSHNLAPHSF